MFYGRSALYVQIEIAFLRSVDSNLKKTDLLSIYENKETIGILLLIRTCLDATLNTQWSHLSMKTDPVTGPK